MNFHSNTIKFLIDYVSPISKTFNINSFDINQIIDFVSKKFEEPLSKKLALGEIIDLDFFLLVNSVLNDLSINK